ncbi:MAG: hypothetical protein H7175_09965 [Burkholderiales bacterium]|nr:hypothetical protein [Anaerolineae bacterium]
MKRFKNLLAASVFALLTIGATNAFAQTLREDVIIIELPTGINGRDGGDVNQIDDIAPAVETPDDPERAVFVVGIMYTTIR